MHIVHRAHIGLPPTPHSVFTYSHTLVHVVEPSHIHFGRASAFAEREERVEARKPRHIISALNATPNQPRTSQEMQPDVDFTAIPIVSSIHLLRDAYDADASLVSAGGGGRAEVAMKCEEEEAWEDRMMCRTGGEGTRAARQAIRQG